MSLSARRAWIEIHNHLLRTIPRIVALRKESVDRNYAANAVDQILPGSLSARRAWIEIVMQEIAQQRKQSLSARRAWIEIWNSFGKRTFRLQSLSARRAWIEILSAKYAL